MRGYAWVVVVGLALAAPAAAPAADAAREALTGKCRCGAVLPEKARYCPRCGAKVLSPGAAIDAGDEDWSLDALADEMMHETDMLRAGAFGVPFYRKIVGPQEGGRLVEAELDGRYTGSQPEFIAGSARLLGLLPAGGRVKQTYLDLLQAEARALYVDTTRTLHMIRREDAVPPLTRRLLVLHECARARDQQHVFSGLLRVSLEAKAGRTHDGTITVMALLDGSGALLEARYLEKLKAGGSVTRAALLEHAEHEAARARRFLERPAYFHLFLGARACGMRFLLRGQPASAVADGKSREATRHGGATGEEELRAIAKDLPMSTEQVLHPEKFFHPLLRDPPISISDPTVERSFALAGGWHVAFRDTFGEMVCALLAGAKDSKSARGGGPSAADLTDPAHYLDDAAAGWGGDRFYLIVKRREARPFVPIGPAEDPYEYRGVWVTVWDTPKDREEFVAAYEKNTPSPPEGRAVERLGQRTAVFFFGFAGPECGSIAARLRESPPTLTSTSLPP